MAQPAYTLISGPDTEPVSVAEMKLWMRVDGVEDDADIAALITENRARAERVTGKVLVSQTWRLNLDYFPTGDEISVERPPLSSVSAITYYDTANTQQTLATSVYQVDSASQPARILLVDGQWWPATYSRAHAVTISFIAGVSAASVNPEFVGRLKAAVAYCYRNREQRDEMYLDSLFASLWGGTY